jgi:hypothetical protein
VGCGYIWVHNNIKVPDINIIFSCFGNITVSTKAGQWTPTWLNSNKSHPISIRFT